MLSASCYRCTGPVSSRTAPSRTPRINSPVSDEVAQANPHRLRTSSTRTHGNALPSPATVECVDSDEMGSRVILDERESGGADALAGQARRCIGTGNRCLRTTSPTQPAGAIWGIVAIVGLTKSPAVLSCPRPPPTFRIAQVLREVCRIACLRVQPSDPAERKESHRTTAFGPFFRSASRTGNAQ